jgi:drug/metabolite transporter (DMT)-like permease
MIRDRATIVKYSRPLGFFCGIVSGICYGIMSFLVHLASGQLPASEIVLVRACCAILVLFPFIVRHRSEWLSRDSTLLWIRSVLGALSVFCFAWNLQHTTVGLANTLFNLAPIAVIVIAAIAKREQLQMSRVFSIVLVVLASALFWHGARSEVSPMVWVVGLLGMCAASVAYAMLRSLPSAWNTLDITWSLNLATLPVALLFKQGPWVVPMDSVALTLAAICILSLAGSALATLSFRYMESSTASALIPSAIVWGVLLDLSEHDHPKAQAIAGCFLYVIAIARLTLSRPAFLDGQLGAVPATLAVGESAPGAIDG